jgi:hypothetical protein
VTGRHGCRGNDGIQRCLIHQGVFAATTCVALTAAFKPAMEGLRAREFGRSKLSVQHVKSLTATATLVTGLALRYKLDGQELERVGVTYVLHKAETRWKIAVLIIHDTHEVTRHE